MSVRVEINPAGSWVDVTSRVRHVSGVSMTRGTTSEGQLSQPGQCNLVFKDTNGDFRPDNPMGAWYPDLSRNTPTRVSETCTVHLVPTATLGATTPDTAALDIVGDIELRVEATVRNWGRDTADLVSKWTESGNQRSYMVRLEAGYLTLYISSNGAAVETMAASAKMSGHGRKAIRVFLDVNNGAGGHTARFYHADAIDGSYTQVGSDVVTAGVVAIYSGTAIVRTGFRDTGSTPPRRVYRARIYNPAGAIVANPDFTAQSAGAGSFADSTGKTWTVTAPIVDAVERFNGYLFDVVPSADISGADITAAVTISGEMRRMERQSPLLSVMRRVNTRASGLLEYWPCEDGGEAEWFGSANGGRPMYFSDGLTLANYSGFLSSSALATVGTSRWSARVRPFVATTARRVLRFLAYFPSSGMANGDVIARVLGTIYYLDVVWLTGGNLRLEVRNISDGSSVMTGTSCVADAIDRRLQVHVELVPAFPTTYRLKAVGLGSVLDEVSDTTLGAFSGLEAILINPNVECAPEMAIGHVCLQDISPSPTQENEINAMRGEDPVDRMARLLAEEGITADLSGTSPQTMHAQREIRLLDILRECESVDHGILCEPRNDTGIKYVGLSSLASVPSSLDLDHADRAIVGVVNPTYDDGTIINDATVTRTAGGTARYTDSASVAAIGRFDGSSEVNISSQRRLVHHPEWIVHLGTEAGARIPVLEFNLTRNPELAEILMDLDIGDRIRVSNPPTRVSYDDLDLLVIGTREYLDATQHAIALNCRPFRPFRIGVYNDPESRYDSSGSSLDAGVNSSATSLTVASTGRPWTATASHFPFDIVIGGERMRVTGVAGASSPQTFTVIRSINRVVKSHLAGASVHLAEPVYYGV